MTGLGRTRTLTKEGEGSARTCWRSVNGFGRGAIRKKRGSRTPAGGYVGRKTRISDGKERIEEEAQCSNKTLRKGGRKRQGGPEFQMGEKASSHPSLEKKTVRDEVGSQMD